MSVYFSINFFSALILVLALGGEETGVIGNVAFNSEGFTSSVSKAVRAAAKSSTRSVLQPSFFNRAG